MTALKLLLVRHGQTPYNRDLKWHENTDIALTELGIKQSKATANALKNEKPVAIYSSHLKRALQTAEFIASEHKLNVTSKPALSEIDAGELGGLTYSEIMKKFPGFFKAWVSDPVNTAAPGGETMASLQSRCWKVIEEITTAHPEGSVIVVSHSFSIASIICAAIKMPLSSFQNLDVRLGSISELLMLDLTAEEANEHPDWRKAAILTRLNDTHHLNGLSK